jgi:hypothetical protein
MNTLQLPACEAGIDMDARFAFEDVTEAQRGAMHWYGHVGDIITTLEDPVAGQYGAEWIGQNFWHPARILRGAIEGRMATPDRATVVGEVTRFALRAYAGEVQEADIIDLGRLAADSELDKVFVEQRIDEVTLDASSPRFSRAASSVIAHKLAGNDALFVPICHGGFVAGVQTALSYSRETGSGVPVYPVRHSREKRQDTLPYVSNQELTILEEVSRDRTVVVYDEDAASGETMRETVNYFDDMLSAQNVIGAVSYDRRRHEVAQAQGTWWEKAKRS